MKKSKIAIISVLTLLLLAGALSFLMMSKSGPEKIYIKTLESNRFQLMIDNKPSIIKGIVYSPVPIGETHTYDFWNDPRKPYLLDGKMMKDIGVNAIRVYQPSPDSNKTKEVMREMYDKFKIRIAIGHWLGFWDNPNYGDPSFREYVKKDVLNMVETYKNEKGLLFWILGNENNVSFSYGPQTMNLWTTDEIEALDDPYAKRLARARLALKNQLKGRI